MRAEALGFRGDHEGMERERVLYANGLLILGWIITYYGVRNSSRKNEKECRNCFQLRSSFARMREGLPRWTEYSRKSEMNDEHEVVSV